MKRVLWSVLILSIAALGYGQEADSENPKVRVALTASPAVFVVLGSPVTFTAVVSPVRPIPPRLFSIPASRLRYTFKAQRTWPCAEAITIAQNSTNATVSWTAPKSGEYKVTVDVRYFSRPQFPASREVDATASVNYIVKPAPGFSHNLRYNVSPASPATAPASISLTVSLMNPPEFDHWYRYKFTVGGCTPATATKNNQPASTSWSTTCNNPGTYTLFTSVDKVRQSSCEWLQSLDTHGWGDPIGYYYKVNAPTP